MSEKKRAEVKKYVEVIDKAFEKNKLSKSVTVFRGVDNQDLAANAESMIGSVIEDKGYVSTTRNQEVTSAFTKEAKSPVLMKIHVPKGRKAIDLEDIGDESAEHATSKYNEKETLLPRNTKLKIVSVDKSGDVPIIHMEVVDE